MEIMQNGSNSRAALIARARQALAEVEAGPPPGKDLTLWYSGQVGTLSMQVERLLSLLEPEPEPESAPALSAARAALAQVEACRDAVARIGGWERGLASEVTAALCGRGSMPLPDLITQVTHTPLPARLAGDRAVVLTALRALDGAR